MPGVDHDPVHVEAVVEAFDVGQQAAVDVAGLDVTAYQDPGAWRKQ